MNYIILLAFLFIINIVKCYQHSNTEENSLKIIQRNWPALSDWICEEIYCSGLRIPKNINHKSLWGTGALEASDEDYQDLHAASQDSEPVDPFDNKDFLLTSTSKLTSHLIRFGIHQYSSKKHKTNESNNKKEKNNDKYKDKDKNIKKKSYYEEDIDDENDDFKDTKSKSKFKKVKSWWSKFFKRQKMKNQKDEKFELNNQEGNLEYLLFASEKNNKIKYSLNNTTNLRNLYLRESNNIFSNYENTNRPDTYVPLEIKTSIFAAYFASEPVLIHFSKTINRNRRVKYGQEIGIIESYPRTINNAISNIILSRCDGTISIINQIKGLPIQSTRMFLVITCNDTPL